MTKTLQRESRALLSSKEGFSVVAPTSVTVPVFHIGEEAVLLGAVEAVYFITNRRVPSPYSRRLAASSKAFRRSRHAGEDGGERHEVHGRARGQNARQRGFSAAGRPPQDEAGQFAGVRHAPVWGRLPPEDGPAPRFQPVRTVSGAPPGDGPPKAANRLGASSFFMVPIVRRPEGKGKGGMAARLLFVGAGVSWELSGKGFCGWTQEKRKTWRGKCVSWLP